MHLAGHATGETWIADADADPVLVVTAPPAASLASELVRLLPDLRAILGPRPARDGDLRPGRLVPGHVREGPRRRAGRAHLPQGTLRPAARGQVRRAHLARSARRGAQLLAGRDHRRPAATRRRRWSPCVRSTAGRPTAAQIPGPDLTHRPARRRSVLAALGPGGGRRTTSNTPANTASPSTPSTATPSSPTTAGGLCPTPPSTRRKPPLEAARAGVARAENGMAAAIDDAVQRARRPGSGGTATRRPPPPTGH